jgi:hypothetical protein
MQVGRIIKTGLAVGVVANVWDYLTNTFLFPMLGRQPESVYLPEELMIERLVVTDFIAAFVFVWFFDRVRSAFGPGMNGGVAYGLSAGILINVPVWVMVANLFRGYPYVDAVLWTAFGILWAVIMGAVAGVVYDKTAPKAA